MRPRFFASAFYFLYFGATSALFPYLSLFYQQVGMDTQRIGVLAALLTVVMLLAGPLWGVLADMFHLHGRMLPLAMLMTLLPVLLLIGASNFWILALLVVWMAICLAPIVPLSDHAVLTLLGDQSYDYGKLRLWGSLGWGLGASGAGLIAERTGNQYAFVVFLCLMAGGVVIATRLPVPHLEETQRQKPELHRFVADKRWWGFLVSVFLFGLAMSTFNNYFSLFMKSLGAGEGLFGLSVAASSVSEIPIFFISAFLLRRWSSRTLLNAALIVMGVRCFIVALIQDPTWAIVVQLLHGPSYSAMWAAGINYAREITPAGLGASAQSLFGATTYSLAGVVGALVGSQIYATLGPSVLFRISGLAAFAGLFLFVVTNRVLAQRKVKFDGDTSVQPDLR